jgi:HEAT repeat protein
MLCVVALIACGGSSGEYRVERDLGADIRALGSDDLDTSDPAADRLVAMGAAAVPALETALGREPTAVRLGVVEVLGRIDDPEALAAVAAAAAHDGDPEVRATALRALGAGAVPEAALPAVEAALADPAPGVRLAAAAACAALCKSPEALERLVTLAIEDQPLPNGIAARAAVIQILASGDPTRAESLRAAIGPRAAMAFHRSDAAVALRAALLASDVGDPGGREVLAHAVGGEAPPLLRLQAVYALGRVGDAGSVPGLAALDGQPGLGDYGYDALRRLAGRDVAGAQAALDRWHGNKPPGELPPPPGAR